MPRAEMDTPDRRAVDDLVELYDRTLADVYRYASRLTGGDRTTADELVQETYLSVFRRLVRADATPDATDDSIETSDNTVGYLIATCRSRFLDGVRAEGRRQRREERLTAERRLPHPVEATDIEAETALATLATLPDEQRAALVLRHVDDLTVADQLARSVSATESLLVRARAALRTEFHERTES